MNKKSYFFSMDAFVAILIISSGFYLIFFSTSQEVPKLSIYTISDDLTSSLSTTKVYDINDELYPYLKQLKNGGNITNYANTLMEQIGEFYVKGELDVAKKFTQLLTYNIIPQQFSYSVIVNGTNIHNRTIKDQGNASTLVSSKMMIMGMINSTTLWGPLEGDVRVWH